jgi:tRNA(Ile)-lysidine synthase
MPWSDFHAKLHCTLRQRGLLHKGQRILVAVSGGQDSLCLGQLLADLQSKWRWELAIAHCNHRWRSDSDANTQYVRELAENWQLPFYSAMADPPPKTEAAARDWRYGELGVIAQSHRFTAVVTGHTLSDRAETFLYNLLRGSGADGLQSMTWKRELAEGVLLVRPLLEMSRMETGQFCQEWQLRVWQDTTNQNLEYARNRIRQELLPYLRTHFNPQVERAIAQTAELLRADVDFLESTATQLYQQALNRSQLPISLNRCLLQEVPLALQRRVVRQFLTDHLPTTPTYEQIEKVVDLIDAPNRSQTDPFPGGAIAQVQQNWILMIKNS